MVLKVFSNLNDSMILTEKNAIVLVECVIKNALGNICDIKLNSAWTFLQLGSHVPWPGSVCTRKLS